MSSRSNSYRCLASHYGHLKLSSEITEALRCAGLDVCATPVDLYPKILSSDIGSGTSSIILIVLRENGVRCHQGLAAPTTKSVNRSQPRSPWRLQLSSRRQQSVLPAVAIQKISPVSQDARSAILPKLGDLLRARPRRSRNILTKEQGKLVVSDACLHTKKAFELRDRMSSLQGTLELEDLWPRCVPTRMSACPPSQSSTHAFRLFFADERHGLSLPIAPLTLTSQTLFRGSR